MTEDGRQTLTLVIQNLRNNIKRLVSKGRSVGEEDTKRALINPLLDCLGWNLQDIDEVRNEYRYQAKSNPVDYALFLMGDPVLFVEAKPLRTSLDDHKWISQTIAYAVEAGVEWCVLTNGDEYRLYNAHALVDTQGKLFRTIQLSDQDKESLTLETLDLLSKEKMKEKQLSVFWKAHFIDRNVKSALEGLVYNHDESLVRLLTKRTRGLKKGDILNSLKRADIRLEFQTLAVEKQPTPPDVPPKRAGRKSRQKAIDAQRTEKKQSPKSYNVELIDLIKAGLIRAPFEIEVTHRKQRHTATIQDDGTIIFNKEQYASLSLAGGYARNISSGPPSDGRKFYQTNGWTFWKYRNRETGKLEVVDNIRQQFIRKYRDR